MAPAPTPSLTDLVAACLTAAEAEGEPGVERLLAANPTIAEAARSQIRRLQRFGLVDTGPTEISPPWPYRILAELGRGGMGVVYLARDVALQRDVALKVLGAARLADPAARARFEREARAVAAVTHPNLVQVFGLGVHAGQPFLVMEYIAGAPMSRLLALLAAAGAEPAPDASARIASAFTEASQGLTLARTPPGREILALQVVRDVARGLASVHARGLVHRDVKPSNVMLLADGSAKLLDFGLARPMAAETDDQVTRTGEFLGTIAYAAPEQLLGREVDRRADVYSCGVMLFELVAGQLPHTAQTAAERLEQMRWQPVPSLRRVHPSTNRATDLIVRCCLDPDPSLRYPDAACLADDLDRRLRGDPVSAGSPPTTTRVARWVRARPRALALATATVAALAFVGQRMHWSQLRAADLATAIATARSSLADVERAAADEWPSTTMRTAVAAATATCRLAAEQARGGDPDSLATASALEREATRWHDEVRFVADLDIASATSGFGSSKARARRTRDRLLRVFDTFGLDLRGTADATWLASALARVRSSHIANRLLAGANHLRLAAVDARGEVSVWERCTALLTHCSAPAVAALYAENWADRDHELQAALERVLPRITDPIEAIGLAVAADRHGAPDLANRSLDALLLQHPSDYGLLLAKATLAGRQGEAPPRRIELLRRALAANPERVPAWVLLVRSLLETESVETLPTCERALLSFPDEPLLWWLRGEAHLLAGDWDTAMRDFEHATGREPGLTSAWERRREGASRLGLQPPPLTAAVAADPWYLPLALAHAEDLARAGHADQAASGLWPCVGANWRDVSLYPPLAAAAAATGDLAAAAGYTRVQARLQGTAPRPAHELPAAIAERALATVEASFTAAGEDEAALAEAWAEAGASLERLIAAEPSTGHAATLRFLEAQLWQAAPPLRRWFGEISRRRREHEPLDGHLQLGARVFDALLATRERWRPH